MYCSAGLYGTVQPGNCTGWGSEGVNTGRETYFQVGESVQEERANVKYVSVFPCYYYCIKIAFLNQVRSR